MKDYDYFINSIALIKRPVEVEGLTVSYDDNIIRIVEDDNLIYEMGFKGIY